MGSNTVTVDFQASAAQQKVRHIEMNISLAVNDFWNMFR